MATRDLTLRATWRRLHDLGYAATSATHPERIVNQHAHAAQRDSFIALGNHPAAVMCYPRLSNGATVEDGDRREVLSLVLTAYLLADAKQSKVVQSVLSDYSLLAGPVRIDGFGNQVRPLRWGGPPVFDGEHSARLAFDDDDGTVLLEHAIAPEHYELRTDEWARTSRVATSPAGSHVIALDGDWKGGHPLETPRDQLPELLAADVVRLVSDVERVRWGARPALAQRECAA